MSRALLWIAGLAAATMAVAHAAHAAGDPAFGDWLTSNGSAKVRVGPCAGDPARACGTIVWMKAPNASDGQPARDTKNPNPALRSRTLVGLPFIADFRREATGRWADGRIYDPDSGKTYRSTMAIGAGDALKVAGCVLVFCQAQTWTRTP